MKKSVCSVVMVAAAVAVALGFAGCKKNSGKDSSSEVSSSKKLDMVEIPGMNISMLRTEVTQGLYESVMGENPSFFRTDSEDYEDWRGKPYKLPVGWDEKKLPVENVSWYDAICFCNKLSVKEGLEPVYSVNGVTDVSKWNYTPHQSDEIEGYIEQNLNASGYRLPTEEEWEYAARGGQNYEYAGSDILDEVGWYWDNSDKKTHPVAQKKANGYGLYDMSGNAEEWCWDQWDSGSSDRVLRGGSYSYSNGYCNLSYRRNHSPNYGFHDRGFRVCRGL